MTDDDRDRAGQEWRSLARLAGEAAVAGVGVVGDVHRAVSRRVESLLPASVEAVAATQTAVADAVYVTVEAGSRGLAALGDLLAARSVPAGAPVPSQTRLGNHAVPVLNGVVGDLLARRHQPLALPMAVRVDGADVPVEAAALADAFPGPTGRIVVFLHGLAENDRFWHLSFGGEPGAPPYGEQLRGDGWTPVVLRYNTGLAVGTNGQALSDLLEALTARWPAGVDDLALVGHSMGGLVARSACHYGQVDERTWTGAVRTVVTLGTPHFGAPLARAVDAAERALTALPETAPLARVLGLRSAGVRDLVDGHVVARMEADPDGFLAERAAEAPFLEHATYCFLAATLTRDPDHPLGVVLGDGLVRLPSAVGAGHARRRAPFVIDDVAHLGGLHHFSLHNHPRVLEQVRRWLPPPTP